ncbi:hypothetical protein NM688_g5996 [Phlebia brevispora]|uniref:Uncharacterized protein n=1 Tax=Phlebia brevispora TaxID=194682 RepID=A0ACC1SLL0_9APHY|nr:hypothetical protein NM688_g5996 [Phlebia brevispora]
MCFFCSEQSASLQQVIKAKMLGNSVLSAVSLAAPLASTVAAPASFPSSGNGLWYKTPGTIWAENWLPVGNGYLAAMTPGGTAQETTQLNIESLWTGGPFQDPTYNGGNKQPSERTQMALDMQAIRQTIFQSSTGTIDNIEELATDAGAYGSYAAAGYLVTTMDATDYTTNYTRWLDLDQAVARTTWTQGQTSYSRSLFCSNSAQACVQHLNTSSSHDILPAITYAFSSALESGLPPPVISCLDGSTLLIQGNVSNPGMAYELMARVNAAGPSSTVNISCTSLPGVPGVTNATVSVTGAQQAWITWVGDTDYDMDAGDVLHSFSFRKAEGISSSQLLARLDAAAPKTATSSVYDPLFSDHVASYTDLLGGFTLSLGQTPNLAAPTDELKAAYQTDVGDPYLEWLLFNYGRYLLASSAPGTLPANLQGKWASDISNAWGADYHSNINIQMNYWFAEMTNMDLVTPLFDYIEKTWAPRGAETALILYNISRGWVTHDEMNTFGHTGMKLSGNSAQWADYPESAVWMMIHVWDHFDYTNDLTWFKAQGWPLLKSVASFHLDKLIPDERFNDSTLVVSPCNSPEQVPITLGCAHSQQLIWQLFNAIEKGYNISGDDDTDFLQEVRDKRARMDKGIHIGSWGQLQEWKVDMDSPTDVHRHLSHLIGLYPGYALTGYDPSIQSLPEGQTAYTKSQVLEATETSLIHRGNGTGPDGDAGWEKVWRAASWAQLGNASQFYHELSYAIERNYGSNLFSLYDPFDPSPIFQIDANLGYPAAVLNALIQAPDVASYSTALIITLLPALPPTWPSGSIRNARVRGGMKVNLDWANGKPTHVDIITDSSARARPTAIIKMSSRPLNDDEVLTEMNKMVAFIKQEALEKAREIQVKADEEFAIEKAKLVKQEQQAIDAQFEKKRKNAEVAQKIAQSTLTNKSRLKLLQQREEHLQDLFDTARKSILDLAADEGRYVQFLENVIVQGFLSLLEPEVIIQSRQKDVPIAQKATDNAIKQYAEISGRNVKATVYGELSNDLAGGVTLISGNLRITLDNTLDERLRLLEDRMLPEIRYDLFGANPNRKFFT